MLHQQEGAGTAIQQQGGGRRDVIPGRGEGRGTSFREEEEGRGRGTAIQRQGREKRTVLTLSAHSEKDEF